MIYSSKLFVALALTFSVIFLASAVAHAENTRIAVVDVDKILSESQAGKSVRQQLKKRREAFQKEFSAREDNLMNAQKALVQKKSELSAEDFSAKRNDFEKQISETRSLFQKRRNSLDKGLGNALSNLRNHIVQVTAEVANEANYQVVLTRDSVIIVEKEMDITETVLLRLNAKVSNIPLDTQ